MPDANAPLRILHLEDSPLDAEVIREGLIDAGLSLQLDRAANKEEFISCLQSKQYDLILADYRLPGFDAIGALILAKSHCPGIPFIAVTGAVGEEQAVALLKQGATDYILKDRLAKLPQAIERALNEAAEQKARREAEAKLYRLNRELRAISDCNQTLMRALDEPSLLDQICRIICTEAGYPMVWVGYAEYDANKTLRPVAWAGEVSASILTGYPSWAEDGEPAGRCIRSGEPLLLAEPLTDSPMALPGGCRSGVFLPLKDESETAFGVLAIYSEEEDVITADELRLLEELAGDLAFGIVTLRARAERKVAEKQIEHLAFYDSLTKLPNRRLLMDRLQQAMASRSRNMGALLFIDLDNFKILNDTCGHDVGDQLLIEVAQRLSACVRDGDTISRLGGDEFIVMLKDLSELPSEAAAQATAIGEKILKALNQPYTIAGLEHYSTPSIGATLFIDHESPADELLKQADIAMYQAKSAGRNTLRFFDPGMQATIAARASLEAALRQSIQEGQFVLHYQAQVDRQQDIVGAEVLLRWQHPSQGIVSPAHFIPLAEETGLILPLGHWVLTEACVRLAAWMGDPRKRALTLAVNVSARQFRQPDFVGSVRHVLETTGAPAARLKLELTESVVLDNIADAIRKMHELKEIGVGFSMDDFGTGYSSLSYLTQLPLDQLKIDKSFVRNLPDSHNDAVVAQAIITLAQSLGLAVVAEGVETEVQRQFLDQHGCPIFQGYLFSKPVALAYFEALID